jgi:two-component system cell cycle sensor histidine kinase PleC
MEMTMREFASVFSGRGELRTEAVRLFDAVSDVLEGFKLQARGKNLTLSNFVDFDAVVSAAPNALYRILANLVGNALRYTRSGGVAIRSVQRETEVEIFVEDTGLGIISEKLTRIFEPGMKEPSSPGMGFGLAIAKYLIEAQGGRISVESTIGSGTVMKFSLPKAVPTSSLPPQWSAAQPAP